MVSSATTIKIGTRGSELALKQAQLVKEGLESDSLDYSFEEVIIKSSGDLDQKSDFSQLSQSEGKGLFTKALDEALIQGKIDLAVHSLKDLPVELMEGIRIGAILKREKPNDVWISKNDHLISDLKEGATVGTGSVRRAAQIKYQFPHLNIVPLRGNITTRLKKLKEASESDLSGIILAYAGLKRLGLDKEISEVFSIDQLLPAVGQGGIAVLIRSGDDRVKSLMSSLDDEDNHLEVSVERTFLQQLGGGCHIPIAALAELDESKGVVELQGGVFSPDGSNAIRGTLRAPRTEALILPIRLSEMLLSQGAGQLLQ